VNSLSEVKPKNQSKLKVYELSLNKRTIIGRSSSTSDIAIKKPEVSSQHATIFHEDGQFWVLDNDSVNGTRLNGLSIKGRNKLNFKDVIKVGSYSFTFICEYVGGKGEVYYLEICKLKKEPTLSPDKTDVTLGPLSNDRKDVDLNLLSGVKKDVDLNLLSGDKKVVKKVSKNVKKQPKGLKDKENKRSRYLKKLGASVSERLKNLEIKHQGLVSSIENVSLVSVICHIGLFYLLIMYVVGTPPPKEIKDVIVNLQDDQPTLDTPDTPEIEIPELEISTETLGNPNLKDLQSISSNTVTSIIESADSLEVSDFNIDNNSQGTVGDVQVGKGHKGVLDGKFMKRVLKSNGRYKGVDIRLTLVWNNTSDLDLHVLTPSDENIFYGSKEAGGGKLDIDKNASDEVRDPVENIIWEKAVDGEYVVSVVLFNNRSRRKSIPFQMEFQIFKDTYYYKGVLTNSDEKNKVEIVSFACREGKYLIRKTINDKAPVNVPEEGLNVLE
jgi:hypothetical protein